VANVVTDLCADIASGIKDLIAERDAAIARAEAAESELAAKVVEPSETQPPVVNVAPATVTVNVPEQAAPTVNVEAPKVNIEPVNVSVDLQPLAEALSNIAALMQSLRDDVNKNSAAISDLARSSMAEKRLIFENGRAVGVKSIAGPTH
jgi:hypothetical protein